MVTRRIARRRLLQGGFVLGGAGLAYGLSAPSLRAATPIKVTNAGLLSGFSPIMSEYMAKKRFDLKHGVDITLVTSYTSVANYYNDFAAGTFDLAIGSWDTFVQLFQRGLPIALVCTASTADLVNIISGPQGPKTVAELKGKSLAAVQNAGMYAITKAVVGDLYKVELGSDVAIQNVPSPAQVVTLVIAGNAAAGLSWEPSISIAMAKVPGLGPIFNLGKSYKQKRGQDLPYFSYALRRSAITRNPDVAERVAAAYHDCAQAIMHDPDEALALAAVKLEVPATVLRAAFDGGRLTVRAESMTDPAGRKLVADAFAYLATQGVFEDKTLGEAFYA